MVWYVNVTSGQDLDRLMTGRDGIRRSVSLPPGAATDEAVTGMRRTAAEVFAPPIAEVVTSAGEPFVQAVYDIDVPRMAQGRVCLIGDAAFAVRPHAAAGTREIGHASQFTGTFRPGDPRLIFGLHEPGH
jgi:2,6-dihydroxypyridine 3-monooxygenase